MHAGTSSALVFDNVPGTGTAKPDLVAQVGKVVHVHHGSAHGGSVAMLGLTAHT